MAIIDAKNKLSSALIVSVPTVTKRTKIPTKWISPHGAGRRGSTGIDFPPMRNQVITEIQARHEPPSMVNKKSRNRIRSIEGSGVVAFTLLKLDGGLFAVAYSEDDVFDARYNGQ